ncbi:MAG: type III polyketide synthase [Planctomycetota bacterium]
MNNGTPRIAGLGIALPDHAMTQADAAQYVRDYCVAGDRELQLARRIYSRSGVANRHSVVLESSTNGESARQTFFAPSEPIAPLGPTTAERMACYRENAGPLACRAADAALVDASVDASEVTHLVTVSCSGFDAPGFDISLINNLPLGEAVSRTHVGFMGCHGALNGLRVARAYAADPQATVLLVALELCSLHYQYGWTPERIVANALFADGAAAAVVQQDRGRDDERLLDSDRLAIRDNWSNVVPGTTDAMTWRIGDHGFEMTLSADLPQLIEQELASRLGGWLASHQTPLEEVAQWVIHPGGPAILDACESALRLPGDALDLSRGVLQRYGNMSSPTVLFALAELLARGSAASPCVVLGFGPGLTIEAALLTADA